MQVLKASFFIFTLLLAGVVYAEGVKIEGLPIKIGDTVEDVQKAFNTKLEPEDTKQYISPTMNRQPKKSQLYLKTKGVLMSFENGKVVSIICKAPFSGNVGGVKIGDPARKIEKTFGKAVKHARLETNLFKPDTYTYYFDDVTTTRFDINNDDEIETIHFFK
jgi:hypothetical protein